MIKTILATSAALLSGTAAIVAPVDPGFGQTPVSVDRDVYSIRACRQSVDGAFDSVCYNQAREISVGALTFSSERVNRINCVTRQNLPEGSIAGQIQREYCPLVISGELAPAPFLF